MRFIHTSDWHLGRLFHGVHLTDEQHHVLSQFVELARDSRPDFIIIAGDIYDRAVPPPEAVSLLNETLNKLALELKIPVFIIAGNHDSPERIGFGSEILAEQKVFVTGPLQLPLIPVQMEDAAGPVCIYSIPYAEPPLIRQKSDRDDIRDHASGMAAVMSEIRSCHPRGARSIVISHAFAAGGKETESERPLSVGGSGAVDIASFEGFDYVALGHLHRPQSVGAERINYSGSLMKYSFSEADHEKSVSMVELDESGQAKVKRVSLSPLRDVRRIEGRLNDLLSNPDTGGRKDDYLMVTLLDRGALLDAMGRLREIYPNVLHIERPFLNQESKGTGTAGDHRKIGDQELFSSFYSQVTGEALSDQQVSAYADIVDKLHGKQRESVQ